MLEASLDVTVGEDVWFRLVVTNAAAEPVEVTFRDAAHADFAVLRDDGHEMWRWSAGKAFMQALQSARFEPGEEAVFEEEWPDPVAGDFTARAELRIVEGTVVAETPFSV
jgi:hypothetical protein